jgi:hypothetical protein
LLTVDVRAKGSHYWTFLFHATPPCSQRADYQEQSVSIVADFAALRGKCPVVCKRMILMAKINHGTSKHFPFHQQSTIT